MKQLRSAKGSKLHILIQSMPHHDNLVELYFVPTLKKDMTKFNCKMKTFQISTLAEAKMDETNQSHVLDLLCFSALIIAIIDHCGCLEQTNKN